MVKLSVHLIFIQIQNWHMPSFVEIDNKKIQCLLQLTLFLNLIICQWLVYLLVFWQSKKTKSYYSLPQANTSKESDSCYKDSSFSHWPPDTHRVNSTVYNHRPTTKTSAPECFWEEQEWTIYWVLYTLHTSRVSTAFIPCYLNHNLMKALL